MELSNFIADAAMGMRQTQLSSSLGIAMAKKSMDTMEVQAQGLLKMAENLPKVQGQIGSVLDVRA